MKIIDKNNQIEQLTSDILKSDELIHYVIYKNGLLYITNLEDAEECINNNNYTPIGSITNIDNNYNDIKNKVKNLIQ